MCIKENDRENEGIWMSELRGIQANMEVFREGQVKVHSRLWAALCACCHSPSQNTAASTSFFCQLNSASYCTEKVKFLIT